MKALFLTSLFLPLVVLALMPLSTVSPPLLAFTVLLALAVATRVICREYLAVRVDGKSPRCGSSTEPPQRLISPHDLCRQADPAAPETPPIPPGFRYAEPGDPRVEASRFDPGNN